MAARPARFSGSRVSAIAKVHDCAESEPSIEVVGDTATASFRFARVYERDGPRYRSTGRDLWRFGRTDDVWQATWRTMLDVEDSELAPSE